MPLRIYKITIISSLILLLGVNYYLIIQSPIKAQKENTNSNSLLEYFIQLKEEYKVRLSPNQKQMVKERCLQITQDKIQSLKIKTNQTKLRYLNLSKTTKNNFRFINYKLYKMNKDASIVNLAQVELDNLQEAFQKQIHKYILSLNQLIAFKDDCHLHPELFTAGLYDLNHHRHLSLKSAKNLFNFIKKDVNQLFEEIHKILNNETYNPKI